jgi:hypothetical protein
MPRRIAATSAGVSPKTFLRWIHHGASIGTDPVCQYLAKEIFQVEGADVSASMTDLKMLSSMSATAAETYLKFMHHQDFGGPTRTGPDEFEEQARNREAQDQLLESPPPRMLAKLRQHRWVQIPDGATDDETATVESIIGAIRMRLSALPKLSVGTDTDSE